MGKKIISLSEPILFGNEIQHIVNSLNANQLVTGQYITKFENKVKNYLNSKYSLACINGTAALHIALKVLGIKEKNESQNSPLGLGSPLPGLANPQPNQHWYKRLVY